MTKWQESCIEALVISPIAFKLFKEKTANKKQVDQYLNRIWPYKIESSNKNTTTSCSIALKPIIAFLEELLIFGENGYYDKSYLFEKPVTAKEILDSIKGIRLNNGTNEDRHAVADLIFRGAGSTSVVSVRMGRSTNVNFIDSMRIEFSKINANDTFTSMITDTHNNRRGTSDFIKELIKTLSVSKKTSNKSKIRRSYNGINVGIEIEYDGCNMQFLEKQLLNKSAISFHSGWDGSSANGDQYSSRLRENRLRINGQRGLSALFLLLESMESHGCKIVAESGMHYHIDCTHRNRFLKDKDVIVRYIKEKEIYFIRQIFEMPVDYDWEKSKRTLLDHLRLDESFRTLEWRLGTATLNYSKLTIQILCAIHCTKMITNNKDINNEYLSILAKLYKKIN